MEIEIQVPQLGESITEATVSAWLKSAGDAVGEGDILVELETDKVMVEVPAVQAGVLTEVLKAEGEQVTIGEVLGKIDTDASAQPKPEAERPAAPPAPAPEPAEVVGAPAPPDVTAQPLPGPAAAAGPAAAGAANTALTPAVQRMVEQNALNPARIPGTGRRGQVTKGDVVDFMERAAQRGGAAPAPAAPPASGAARAMGEREQRVPMSRLRQRIAERLVEAQRTAAILTTFNEVDMSAVMALRNKYKDSFREKYGIALGFMSFFSKAAIEALRAFPAVNAEIEGQEIVYKNYYDIGVAVGTEKGLVVPVVRDADALRFIEIEQEIARLAQRAREGKLGLEELTGGTFTISNGGIYGSMLSTPILNPPQSGILGLHNIVKRAVVRDDEVVVRPMMYLALSYDHRIIDGREAVQFLVKVKECIEDPARMLLEI
jgi:2-oxoglutarate dehydrogenase E2 component (dihydrolipoamide succinyltransferase)